MYDAGNSLFAALNLADAETVLQVPDTAGAVLAGEGGLDPQSGQLALPAGGWAVLAGTDAGSGSQPA